MTDVHTPESEPESGGGHGRRSHALVRGQPGRARRTAVPAGPAATGEPSAGWLRWGWRQLTSMRTALILLFLLALGSIPGSVLPQQGSRPGRGAAVLRLASRPRALAEPPRAVQRVRRALVRGDLPAALRVAGRVRGAADLPARRRGADAAAARAAEPGPAAALGVLPLRAVAGRRRSTRPPRCSAGSGSGCGGRPRTATPATGCRRRRGTCARSATCCSTCRCSACCSRSRPAGCSATRPTSCSSRGRRSPTPPPRSTSSTRGGWSPAPTSPPFSMTLNKFTAELHRVGRVARAAVELRRRRHLHGVARRDPGDLPHQDQRPAVGRLAEGLPDRARLRARSSRSPGPTARWRTRRRPRSSRLTRARSCPTGWSRRRTRLARLHGRLRADRDLGRRDA